MDVLLLRFSFELKKSMDDANVPMKQQIFYLEAIANDASKLIPLLDDNGAAWARLSKEAHDAGVVMSEMDITALRESEKILSRTGQQIGASFARFVAGAADQIAWLGTIISDAMIYWGTLFDSLPDKPKTFDGMIERGAELKDELDRINVRIERLKNSTGSYNQDVLLASMTAKAAALKIEIKELTEARWELAAKPITPAQPALPDFTGIKGIDSDSQADESISTTEGEK
nr:hypothetical protein [Endozoicomonas sp.]